MYLIDLNREELLKPLSSVTGIIEKKHTQLILSNVLIKKENNKIIAIGTDSEIQISHTQVIDKESENFNFTTSAKKLLDILKAIPEKTNLNLNINENKLEIKAGKSKFNLQTLPSIDFPVLNIQENLASNLRISQKILKKLIHSVQYAMAVQDIRYYLNGLCFLLDQQLLHVITTDGHRLAHNATEINYHGDKIEMIIPRKTILEIYKNLSDSDDEVMIEYNSSQIKFNINNLEIISKLIDGKFPDFNRVIPKNNTKQIVLNRINLLQSLQRTAILSNEKFRGVQLEIYENKMFIMCNNSEQEEAYEEIEITYNDEKINIGFNINYLSDVIANLNTDYIHLNLNDNHSSALITIAEDTEFKYVVMPLRM